MRRGTAVAWVIASAACFGTLAVLTTLAYEQGARPLPMLTWRFALATLVMGGYLGVMRPGALRIQPGDVARYALLSVTGYGAASLCFFFALRHATASVVAVLLYTYPALVALGEAVARRRRPSALSATGIAVTFAGCTLVVGLLDADVVVDPTGVVLGLGAAVAYATFTMLSDRLTTGRSRLVVMTYMFGMSTILMAGITLVTGESLSTQAWGSGLWTIVGLIVALPTIVAVVLYMGGIRRLGPARAALASATEPIFTIALSWLVLGEQLSGMQALGSALVVTGIVLAEWSESRDASAMVAV